MIALYADENFSFRVIDVLVAAGYDVLTARDDGRANIGIPDPLVVRRATELGRAVITFNRRHYVACHRADPAHAGIVAVSEDTDVQAVSARVLAALADVADLTGRLITVDLPSRPRPQVP
jgi:predicted nuclease of predicted toxin-antitoxin system